MSNTTLTVDEITRESLRILHQKLRFVGSINRGYDGQFAQEGAKIGDTLRIRLPNQYTIRTGRTLAVQDNVERNVTFQISNQAGVDINFTSAELTLSLDEFSERIIQPAMATIAAYIESTVWTARYKDVYNLVDQDGVAPSLRTVLLAKKKLDDNLAPEDEQRTCLLSTTHQVGLVDYIKGLFNPQDVLSMQYKEGRMGKTAMADFFQSTHVLDHTTGTAVKGDTTYNVNGANQTGSTLTVNTGTTSFLKGDVITIAGCNRVHPETKVDTGELQQFVITADSGTNATSLSISPAIITSGGAQNVSGSPTNGGAVSKIGAGASELLTSSMMYHKDAFCFGTADLILPEGVSFAAREVYDGISMRIVRAYDINNDQHPCRIDVLFGSATLRAQLATRVHADG
jgi:hypothetical protein